MVNYCVLVKFADSDSEVNIVELTNGCLCCRKIFAYYRSC